MATKPNSNSDHCYQHIANICCTLLVLFVLPTSLASSQTPSITTMAAPTGRHAIKIFPSLGHQRFINKFDVPILNTNHLRHHQNCMMLLGVTLASFLSSVVVIHFSHCLGCVCLCVVLNLIYKSIKSLGGGCH